MNVAVWCSLSAIAPCCEPVQAGAKVGEPRGARFYLAHRSVKPLPRLIAAERCCFQIEGFRYSPYSGLQSNRLTSAVSVSRITKVVQLSRLLSADNSSFFCHNQSSLL